ncbi:MAG: T9SS type A sorting domain-containing protein [Hymenobacter sp.]|nr:MAG: T9SS type A sorting domain-containing protein [Hymenobacter sp.]
MKSHYFFNWPRWWPGAASLLGLLAASPLSHAQTTLYNPAGSTLNQAGSLYTTGTVQNAGTYVPTSGTLLVAGGDFLNTGTITTDAATGTVKLVESAAGIGHSLALGGGAVPNLELDVPANTTMGSDGTVLGTLTLRNGHLLTSPAAGNTYVLTLGPAATLVGETDAHYVKGRVAQARNLSGNSPVDFGSIGLTINPAGNSFPISVERRASLNQAGVSYASNPNMPTQQGIDRVWALSSTTATLATPATLTLSWLAADDHGLTFSGTNAQVWRSDDGGTNWVMQNSPQDGTSHSVSVETTRLNALYTVSSSASPLPVTLTSFTAQLLSSEAVGLTWNTASEVNTDRFEVERSSDGVAFTRLGTVAAHGTSTTAQAYTQRDATLPTGAPILYYRLRIVDHDKSAVYSPVRTVAPHPAKLAVLALSVAPNPTTATTPTALWVTSSTTTPGTLTILNALGQVVDTRNAALAEGLHQLPVSLQGLPAGMYTLRLQATGSSAVAKLLIQ